MGNNNEKGEKAYSINRDTKHTLGEGTYAVVYRVRRKSDKRVCAAKIFKMKIEHMGQVELMGFKREMTILRESWHPFVIEFIDEFIYNKIQMCIVTGFASGGNLATYMR
jgi:serine/threonine protein kinase